MLGASAAVSQSKMNGNAIIKVLIELFQKFAVSKGSAFGRCPQTAKYPLYFRSSERGALR